MFEEHQHTTPMPEVSETQLEREIRMVAERTMMMRAQGFVTHLIVNRNQPAYQSR